MNDLGFVEAVDRLCESIVIAVADAADGRLDPSFGPALSVADADLLRSAIRVMHETTPAGGPTLVQRLLQRIQHEAGVGGPAHAQPTMRRA